MTCRRTSVVLQPYIVQGEMYESKRGKQRQGHIFQYFQLKLWIQQRCFIIQSVSNTSGKGIPTIVVSTVFKSWHCCENH